MKNMAYNKTLYAATARGLLVLALVCSLASFALGKSLAGTSAERPPVATSLRAITSGETTMIEISGTAPMPFTVRKPDARQLVVELPGVDSTQLAPSYSIASPLVESVTVTHLLRDGEPVSSLQVSLRAPVRERSRLDGSNLVVELTPEVAKDSTASGGAAPQSRPTPTQANANQTPQTSQGAQYGQSGFVGEPINLNVVNADIRDILNYITEQYGVNFVVDSSVHQVPVTINVTDVPWNFALDSILKANRLGIEVNGNILRIATLEVLKDESKIRAEEESARASLRDAQLQNAPLVTEFLRLNYARAEGTLDQAAGSTGGYAGGLPSGTTSNTAVGVPSGDGANAYANSPALAPSRAVSSGDRGILPIVQRRLSKRGSVEVDGRSNTLIVTDVKENIDSIRHLVELLDQPEPQVEIETRVVIASRNFSRDLGVQFNAAVISARGGSAGFNTAPGAPTPPAPNVIGPRQLGIPQGIQNPSGALGANTPNTVIGLTTGIFGTAQLSALITAAESRGQAKIVATPRVTALNNRPAQIESGSQIPVVTPQQSTGGGSVLFTTTFVSVPLRLSVTPQITDAGTVILHVTLENNSVNLTLTNSLGTPGVDTQRMSTEVLVPDGGTTVMGGVLNDRESETQNRTPGLGGLPVLGNLFKRKAVLRNTDEILFFITPRIYRPDYQGHRVDNEPTNGTRSIAIPQPVPLGNPSSNTPGAGNSPNGQQMTPVEQNSVPPAANQRP
jgi:type IV pilus assembly protein PilQ